MHDTITLKEVLQQMDSGAHFSIAFVTANKNKNKGGEWIEIAECWKGFERTEQQRKKSAKTQPKTVIMKNPNHFENSR